MNLSKDKKGSKSTSKSTGAKTGAKTNSSKDAVSVDKKNKRGDKVLSKGPPATSSSKADTKTSTSKTSDVGKSPAKLSSTSKSSGGKSNTKVKSQGSTPNKVSASSPSPAKAAADRKTKASKSSDKAESPKKKEAVPPAVVVDAKTKKNGGSQPMTPTASRDMASSNEKKATKSEDQKQFVIKQDVKLLIAQRIAAVKDRRREENEKRSKDPSLPQVDLREMWAAYWDIPELTAISSSTTSPDDLNCYVCGNITTAKCLVCTTSKAMSECVSKKYRCGCHFHDECVKRWREYEGVVDDSCPSGNATHKL